MVYSFPMAAGQRVSLDYPVVDWELGLVDGDQTKIKLTALVQVGSSPPISPNLGPKATTLAVQMDAQVAMLLYAKLGLLIRNTGWPLEEGD